jgi:mannose-1-phosphate guanylyltransferase
MNQILPVILCGGSGNRMWPLSRGGTPKQFLSLVSNNSMFQDTVLRLARTKDKCILDPVIICNKEYKNIVVDQLSEINAKHNGIILEPSAKNTAPASTIAAMHASNLFGEEVLVFILPADHFIENEKAFLDAMLDARKNLTNFEAIVTFGIKPNSAHTGYGYIEIGEELSDNNYKIKRFQEKPNQETANNYLNSGNYLWNSGMFIYHAKTFLKLIEKFSPLIANACSKSYLKKIIDDKFIWLDEKYFLTSPADSIDYAIMEKCVKCDDAVVIPMDVGWSDVGAWSSLWAISKKNKHANVTTGSVYSHETSKSFIYSDDGILATVGIDNLVIVNTRGATLVASMDHSENVGKVVRKLDINEFDLTIEGITNYLDWGNYTVITSNDKYIIKRLIINSNSMLISKPGDTHYGQMNLINGQAKVTRKNKSILLRANDAIFLSNKEDYCIENEQDDELEIIEVQICDALS